MLTTIAARRRPAPATVGILWVGVVLLAFVGVASVTGRAMFRADFGARMQPVRLHVLDAIGADDPYLPQRDTEVAIVDSRYAARPVMTLLHVVAGGLFLVLAPLQFASRVRRRFLRFHRWSGRILIVSAFVGTLSGFYFGWLTPYGGAGETIAITLTGGLFLVAVTQALIAIRKREVARHREWMIRAFAVAIGTSTVRVIAALLDVTLTPAGVAPATVFVLSIWTGWSITIGAAELWITYTSSSGLTGTAPAASMNPESHRPLTKTACALPATGASWRAAETKLIGRVR